MNAKELRLALLAAAVAGAVFLPVTGHGFLSWDDNVYVTKNELITRPGVAPLFRLFTSFHQLNYHPLALLTYAAEYRLFGMNPAVFHLTNLALHCANTFLVFALFSSLGAGAAAAFIGSLLFGIHPLKVESVAWISERRDVLFSFFYLISLVLYLKAGHGKKRAAEIFSLAAFLLALLSKAMAVTLPAVLLVLKKQGGETEKDRPGLAPYFFLSAVFLYVTWLARQTGGDILEGNFFRPVNLLISGYAYMFYIVKFILPSGLSPMYPVPSVAASVYPAAFRLYGPLFLLGSAVFFLKIRDKTQRFGLAFYLITLFPTVNFFRSASAYIAADRYSYLPAAGLALIAGTLACGFYVRQNGARRKAVLCAGLALLAAYVLAARTRLPVWKNNLSLYNDAIAKLPWSPLAFSNRGNALARLGRYGEALSDFDRAISLKKDYASPYLNRGLLREIQKEPGRAAADYLEAARLEPGLAAANRKLGDLFSVSGRHDLAAGAYSRAFAAEPADPGLLEAVERSLALSGDAEGAALALRYRTGQNVSADELKAAGMKRGGAGSPDTAVFFFSAALRISPGPELYAIRAEAFYSSGFFRSAAKDLEEAIRRGSGDGRLYRRLGDARAEMNDHQAAIAAYSKALALEPRDPVARNNRGTSLHALGRLDEAIEDYSEAIDLSPGYALAWSNRGAALAATGRNDLAVRDLQKAVLLDPEDQKSAGNLRKASGALEAAR